MIEFEILASPDPEVIGRHQFFCPEVEMGNSLSCHLPVEDPQLPSRGIYFISDAKGVVIKTTPPSIFFVNKEEIFEKKLIQSGDEIKIGETQILIASYNFETIHTPLDMDAIKAPLSKNKEEGLLLESLENELLFIDYERKD